MPKAAQTEQRDTVTRSRTETVWANRLASALHERDQYKAHAARLAEAARDLIKFPKSETTWEDLADVLAQWEGEQK